MILNQNRNDILGGISLSLAAEKNILKRWMEDIVWKVKLAKEAIFRFKSPYQVIML